MGIQLAIRQNPAMYFRVQGLDSTIETFWESGDFIYWDNRNTNNLDFAAVEPVGETISQPTPCKA